MGICCHANFLMVVINSSIFYESEDCGLILSSTFTDSLPGQIVSAQLREAGLNKKPEPKVCISAI